MKKFLLTLFFVFIFANKPCFCEPWHNDLRTLFLENKSVIYVINIRTFGAKDKDGDEIIDNSKEEFSGNFVNAVERLDELKGLGINTVHILPVTKIGKLKALGTAGSLYSLADFTSLNEQLDDPTNFSSVYDEAINFINECHNRGIRVILDLPSCGSYDLYLANPGLFVLNQDSQPVVPADWTDVRLYKVLEKDNSINEELFDLHRDFVDMAIALGADGIRADVATIKPYEFWQMLIQYARRKDSQFLFIAEASKVWNTPPAPEAVFCDYQKLLSAGFDGVLGDYMNLKNFKSSKELFVSVEDVKNISQRVAQKKALVGNFATHDDISPMLVNKNYPKLLAWLSATLPLNTYFVDGFATGDYYIYPYSNKLAPSTLTDDSYYYTHKGKLDIFNFSRKPGGENYDIWQNFKLANEFKTLNSDTINNGVFSLLKTNNPNLFAYECSYKNYRYIVLFNHSSVSNINATVYIKHPKKHEELLPLVQSKIPVKVTKNRVLGQLEPFEVVVLIKK